MKKIQKLSIWLFFFFVCVYSLSFSFHWTNRNIGEGYVKIAILETLINEGTIGLPAKAPQSVAGKDGRFYTWHEFGQNFLVLPFYLFTRKPLGDAFAFFLICFLSGALGCVLFMRILILLGYRKKPAVLTTLAYGLCTFVWFYSSKTTYEHSLEVMFVLSSFYFALKYAKGMGQRNILWCALSVGIGLIIRNHIIFSLLPLGILFWLSRDEHRETKASWLKLAAIFAISLVPFILFTFYYNHIRFGSIFETGYGVFYPNRQMFSLSYLKWGLPGFLISPGKSMFLFSPVLILFPFGLGAFYRKVDRGFFFAGSILVMMYTLFFAAYVAWDGDWSWGPRIFIVTTPFLMMPIASLFDREKKLVPAARYAVLVVIILSFCVQLLPVASNFYLSLAWKYGVDDPRQPELIRTFKPREERYKAFFTWKYAYVPRQFDVFVDTYRVFFNNIYALKLQDKVLQSDTPQIWRFKTLYLVPDLWWLQIRSSLSYFIAGFIAFIGGVSLFKCLRFRDT